MGAVPYHDFAWYYGPLSLLYNGLLFKIFGPGMMVLALSNLMVYTAIVILAYWAFRMAWGWPAAFAALAVFISVFSFSLVNAVGNYNYILPYSNEATHGVLLALLTALVAARWSFGPSNAGALLLGLCGGMAAVLKPEFMLVGGALGGAALVLRYVQRKPPAFAEFGLIAAGVLLPTLLLSLWFVRGESLSNAIIDASQAWWFILFKRPGSAPDESGYMGYDNAWRNVRWELAAALSAALIIGAIWAAGWFLNRPWKPVVRWAAALAAGFLACQVDMGGGFEIGPCLPGLVAAILVVVIVQLTREWRRTRQLDRSHVMRVLLVILAASLLTRMILRTRINHFGFVQAAFAGMVVTAFIVAEVPGWTGQGRLGRGITLAGIFLVLTMGCGAVMAETARNHAIQTQAVGRGADQFYAFDSKLDETGMIVDWCAEKMSAVKTNATLLVLPEGVMVNYLSRHVRPMPEFAEDEAAYVKQMAAARPDYIIRIWGDQRDGGIPRFGDPGQPGEKIRAWLDDNYSVESVKHGRAKWAFILHKKSMH